MTAPVLDRPTTTTALDLDRCTVTRSAVSTRIVPNYPVFDADGNRVLAVVRGPNFDLG